LHYTFSARTITNPAVPDTSVHQPL
jgi:hypothetical protein